MFYIENRKFVTTSVDSFGEKTLSPNGSENLLEKLCGRTRTKLNIIPRISRFAMKKMHKRHRNGIRRNWTSNGMPLRVAAEITSGFRNITGEGLSRNWTMIVDVTVEIAEPSAPSMITAGQARVVALNDGYSNYLGIIRGHRLLTATKRISTFRRGLAEPRDGPLHL